MVEPKTGSRSTPWSLQARSVWAKTDPAAETSMSLVRHLEDTAAVAGALWDHWLPPIVRRQISQGLPNGEDDGRTMVRWLAGTHDIGKATPGFAVKARATPGFGDLVDAMERNGLACPSWSSGGEKLPPHCRLGHFVLSEWLNAHYGGKARVRDRFAVVVGGHHGVPPTELELDALKGSKWIGSSPAWRDVREEIMSTMAATTGASARIADWYQSPPGESAQVLLTAVVVVADWLASDSLRFPHEDERISEQRLQSALIAEDLMDPWSPTPPVASAAQFLHQRFPRLRDRPIRPVQEAAYEVGRAAAGPQVMVIEAPMGTGKTEAALLAAEAMAAHCESGGIFVGLPTMATSDAMFRRVLDWTRNLDQDSAATIFLAHSRARLNDDYRGLLRASANVAEPVGFDADNPDRTSLAVVSSWLTGRRKGMLASVAVGTIDQLLFAGLKTRYLVLRHLAVAGKVVIVDEVHAADVYMQQYLLRALEWLGAYGVPVVLLSATLPPQLRRSLLEAYGRGCGVPVGELARSEDYPRITAHGQRTTVLPVVGDGRATSVRLVRLSDDSVELRDRVLKLVAEGACVVIIRNTVQRAQDCYAALSEWLAPERITLLHSRFLAVDRAHREAELIDLLGPDTGRRPSGFVVVGTQVLEQSLDIDADVMFSDLAPVDLILQRAGRLHRHQRGPEQSERPEPTRTATLYVTGVIDWFANPPEFDPGSEAVYGRSLLLRASVVLGEFSDHQPLQLPHDIPRLVESAYDPDLLVPEPWRSTWDEAEAAAERKANERASKAQEFMVTGPDGQPSLVGWLEGRAGADDAQGRAQVRDTEDSVEVIVVQRDSGGVLRVPASHSPRSGEEIPNPDYVPPDQLALELANCTVRLPKGFSRSDKRMDVVIADLEQQGREFVGWQSSKWLQGQLVLCLDEDLNGEIGGTKVRYDRDRGLLVGSRADG